MAGRPVSVNGAKPTAVYYDEVDAYEVDAAFLQCRDCGLQLPVVNTPADHVCDRCGGDLVEVDGQRQKCGRLASGRVPEHAVSPCVRPLHHKGRCVADRREQRDTDRYVEPCLRCRLDWLGPYSLGCDVRRIPARVQQIMRADFGSPASADLVDRELAKLPRCPACHGERVLAGSAVVDALRLRTEEAEKRALRAEQRARDAERELEDVWTDDRVNDIREAGRRLLERYEQIMDGLRDVERGIYDPGEILTRAARELDDWKLNVRSSDEIMW